MKNILIKSFKLFCLLTVSILAFSIVSANELCEDEDNRFIIKWNTDIITQQITDYSIVDTVNWNDVITAKFDVLSGTKKLISTGWESISFSSDIQWKYLLTADFAIDNCRYVIESPINVYNSAILYIWEDLDDFKLWYESNFKDHWILFTKIISNNNVFFENEFKEELITHQSVLNNASIIILNTKDLESTFQVLSKLDEINGLNLSSKSMFIVNNTNKHFMKRTLSKYSSILENSEKYMVNSSDLLTLLSNLSFNKDVVDDNLIDVYSLSFESRSAWLFLSYFIDKLIANGIPINLIWILLTLTVATLVVTAFRQVIWFSVFWTFSPLIFGLSIAVLGSKTSIVFFIIAIIATLLTRAITKKLYLLSSAKFSLLLSIYFLTTILILWLDSVLGAGIISYQIFNNTYVIFPILFLIFTTDKIFGEWYNLFSKQQLVSLIEFIIISVISFWIINSVWLRLILLSYPEIIILIILAIIVVGRFTWLQLLEYFRFSPILKWDWNEEEEE